MARPPLRQSPPPGPRERLPYRIGALVDLPPKQEWLDAIRLAFEEAHGRGVVDRPIELVHRDVWGQPWTDGLATADAWVDLFETERVLGILGPMTTDNCLAVLPEVEARQVPTLAMCGTTHFTGRHAFLLTNGGLADEPAVIAAWLRGEGHRRVTLLRETTQIGEEYTAWFRLAAEQHGLRIVAESPCAPLMEVGELVEALRPLQQASADALVYLGLGRLNQVFRPAFEALGWDPPRIMCTAFVRALVSEEDAQSLEGWVGVDQYDERNEVFAAVLDRFERRYGYRPENTRASVGYDMGQVMALALGRMRIATPAGLRDALETIRRLPACTGAPSTVITFGEGDHRGYRGADFLVLRRASGGKTEFVGTAPILPPWHS
jgi:ABC-type branched-subunit amino acid transport system substrate-binding protein